MPFESEFSFTNNQACYCALCDTYFPSLRERAAHIQDCALHPECDYCKRRFLNKHTRRNHYVYSKHHHYCASCEIEFDSRSALRYHIEYASVHRDDSDDEGDEDDSEYDSDFPQGTSSPEWENEMGLRMYPEEVDVVELPDDSDSDDSWEAFDDYDYEDVDDLLPQEEELEEDDDEEEEEGDEEGLLPQFSCPMCQVQQPNSIACAPCGHMFCSSCISQALKHTHECPACAEPASVEQLRKIFLV
ncbi:RING-type domain-containing protein [Favolaschia claudopus]|uniref:RING-type domain-containing protein n=1 Tax=Favolaschia claudopus TaxID=2862362 RepID=A0AAW0D6X8_9AGAR